MIKTSGAFRATVFAGWILLAVIGLMYARSKGIPTWAAYPALAALLIDYPFYLVPAFPTVRRQFSGDRLPLYLIASVVLPYLIATRGAIHFEWIGLIKLIALCLALGLWYRVLPAVPVADIGFLALVVAIKLGKFTAPIYATNFKGLQIAILGDIALFQIMVMVLMLERHVRETGYGFLPTRRDWRIGATNFAYFVPIGFSIALGTKALHLIKPSDPLKLAGTFLGVLFVLTLAEEFLFRGVLQEWIENWTWNRHVALAITSLLFGGVHLWFRTFPNWKWVLIAGVLGWFCGRARNQAGSIRASMVTHSLVIVTWRAFFDYGPK